jgi:hypothetical protein
MDNPYKVIHSYNNKNKKRQYNVLIFVGNLISDTINNILKKIKDKNLYDSLIDLNERDIENITEAYGNKWYKFFFIDKHINYTFDKIIKTNENKKKDIIKKYGEEWYSSHIDNYKTISKTIYSYQSIFKQDKDIKLKNQKVKNITDTDNLSYKLDSTSNIITGSTDTNLVGGNLNNSDELFVNNVKNRLDLEKSMEKILQNNSSLMNKVSNMYDAAMQEIQEGGNLSDSVESESVNSDTESEISIEELDLSEQDNEFNIDELEKLNLDEVNIDKDADKINKALQDIIDIDKSSKNSISNLSKWNESKDNNMYDEDLINVYTKTYIFNQYILEDDTIKTIKNKICNGYGKSKEFDKLSPYFMPSRLYLWSEYEYLDISNIVKQERVMIGHKWIKRNELLEVDIKPNNNLRVYETLKGTLKLLQENINKYSSRISFENDDQVILYDYLDFINNNELYMIDIYNELGPGYSPSKEQLKNLYDVYIKIYFIGISLEDLNNIILYLGDNKMIEGNKINSYYRNSENDLLMENEIVKTIEELKKNPKLYNNIFKENYITHSVIHINIKHHNFKNSNKIDLYRIFDNFIVNEKYPFIQYQTNDGKLNFKYYSIGEEHDKQTIVSKWFENAPYGISFKINVESNSIADKYIAISLNENGRMDYKTQWKEENKATFNDVQLSYEEVRILLKKLNQENNKLKVDIPTDDKFRFAFINTIQQFELPEKCMISHNDLSDFARYFYPYIAVVIEPRKRQSKILKKNEKSKYGTYLRYKRISKYDNDTNLEKRIVYFLRNYEFNEKLLSLEISKQFNITDKDAVDKINYVLEKYPHIKKSRNILKKFENISKYKPPGIGIDIQGKHKNNYKMRINGARTKLQLNNIINFMNILIYLYIETYFYKKPERQILKNKLMQLNNIAKRRNKVDDIFDYTENIKSVKQVTKLDKERLGYKPEKGQNQWTRNCQNSGKNKRRQPIPYTEKNIEDMIRSGYNYNEDTGDYEKKVGKNILKAAKIESGDGNNIYYTCDPKENGEYMYVGFLSRSANPHGLCMPCCFKKDPLLSKNKEKNEYHLKCIGKLVGKSTQQKLIGDKLYILQDSNKIQDGRFGYLPEYLDIYLNTLLKKDKIIKNNYLTNSNNGWFFKYGIKQEDDTFLATIAYSLDLTIQNIKDKITDILLKADNREAIFTSLNNGDIRTQFTTINAYIRYLHTNYEIEYKMIADILAIPGIVHDYGLNIIIFDKLNHDNIDDKNFKDDFNLEIINMENLHLLEDSNKINLILIKEELNYYPIYQVIKKDSSKSIDVEKVFKYESNNKLNVINHIYQYIKMNYLQTTYEVSKIDIAKKIFNYMEKYSMSDYYPTNQIIDKRNKCKYFVIKNKYLIPIRPSGALFWIPVTFDDTYDKYLNDIYSTSDILYDIYHKSEKNIACKPLGIYYSVKNKDNYTVDAIIIDKHINIPIKQVVLTYNDLIAYAKKFKIKELLTEFKSIYDVIDKELNKSKYDIVLDKRIINVMNDSYKQEGFELFRLEFAYFLRDQEKLKEKIIKLIHKNNIDKNSKKMYLKKIIYKIINKKLYDLYLTSENIKINDDTKDDNLNQDLKSTDDLSDYLDDNDLMTISISNTIQMGGSESELDVTINPNRKLVHIDKEINVNNYIIENNREICPVNIEKDGCNLNPHCTWKNNSCLFRSNAKTIIEYINRITEELINNDLKSNELLMQDNYFVSDIANREYYKSRSNQKIIKSENNNIKKLLSELFGKNNVPIIGKRRMNKLSKNVNEDNILNPLEKIGNTLYQQIHFNNSIYRSYANSYFWLKNSLMDITHRNLGYYNPLQTDLANYFKSNIIDWIMNRKNQQLLMSDLKPYIGLSSESFINDFKKYLAKSSEVMKVYIIELYILSKINKYTIVLHDNYDNIIGVFEDGIKFLKDKNQDYDKTIDKKKTINIKYNIINFSLTNTPNIISSIYYL